MVQLTTEPTGMVTVTVGGAGSDVTVSPASLSFSPSNWNIGQPVTVSGSADDDATTETVTLSHSASNGGYDGVSARPGGNGKRY